MRRGIVLLVLAGCASPAAPVTDSLVITAAPAFVEQLVDAAARDLGWYQDDAGGWHAGRERISIMLQERQGSTVIRTTGAKPSIDLLFESLRKRLNR